jgi:uncharacterized protein
MADGRARSSASVIRSIGLGVLGGAAVALALSAALTIAIARRVVTPPKKRDEDIRILALTDITITLSRTPDSGTPGQYGLWFNSGTGHARIGEILDSDSQTVTRSLIGVDFGDLASARHARLNGWFYLRPRELEFHYSNVEIEMENGPSPAWLIPSEHATGKWAIQVHGRAVSRSEGLRAVPVFREAGYTTLLISYRNDGDAPASADRRYALGETEWRDVDSAIGFALESGATDVVLMGWSMGGATVLQSAMRSAHRDFLRGLVLESPVIDWVSVLDHQGAAMLVPSVIRRAALAIIGSPAARRLTGQSQAIDLDALNFVARASELDLPILLLHSDDDGYVPDTPSRALAAARPDIVTFDGYAIARHAKLWNYDQGRWNGAIAQWLISLESAQSPSGRRARSRRRRGAASA